MTSRDSGHNGEQAPDGVRVVFVNRFFFPDHSATSQLLSDLAFYLAEAGFDVHVVSGRHAYDDPGVHLAATEACNGVQVHRVWTTAYGRRARWGRTIDYLTFHVAASLRLLLLLRRRDVVVAMTDPPLLSLTVSVVARIKNAILLQWVQDLFPEVAAATGMRFTRGAAGRLLTRLRDASLRVARLSVVIGEGMERYLRQRESSLRVVVVPNWADGAAIYPCAPARNPLRSQWKLQERFVVGYSGNLGRVHDAATLLDTVERLRSRCDVLFMFIGGGSKFEWLARECAARGLGNVVFQPYQPRSRLALSLAAPDVHLITQEPATEAYVVPSKFYGVAAAGRPTLFVGDGQGEIARLLERFGCGLTVRPGDSAELARDILQLKEDAHLRSEMGNRARLAFEKFFDCGIALAQWERILTEVTNAATARERERSALCERERDPH